MFAELAKVAEAHDCASIDWKVPKFNEEMREFSTAVIGATPSEDFQSMRVDEEGIESLKLKYYEGDK